MATKYPLWKAINAQLKVGGSTTKLRALDEFRAKTKLKDDWCTLHASYQPREGRIAGHLRFELVAEGPEAMTVVANFLTGVVVVHTPRGLFQLWNLLLSALPELPRTLAACPQTQSRLPGQPSPCRRNCGAFAISCSPLINNLRVSVCAVHNSCWQLSPRQLAQLASQ